MEKKIYVAPCTEMLEIETEMLLTLSAQDVPEETPSYDDVDTDDVEVLSKGRYEW